MAKEKKEPKVLFNVRVPKKLLEEFKSEVNLNSLEISYTTATLNAMRQYINKSKRDRKREEEL